jgi:hypothetical protein
VAESLRQARANARARAWGFKNDYEFRKFSKKSGITGLRGKARTQKILESLDSPKRYSQARKTGKLAQELGFASKKEMDAYIKKWRGRKGSMYGLPSTIRSKKDWDLLVAHVAATGGKYTSGQPAGDASAIAHLIAMNRITYGSMSVEEFRNKYRNLFQEMAQDRGISEDDAFLIVMRGIGKRGRWVEPEDDEDDEF